MWEFGMLGWPMPLNRHARNQLDARVLATLARSEWQGALTIARRLGLPWQPVSYALRRLYCLGRIEQREVEWMAKKYRIKKRLEYRAPTPMVRMPKWLSPERVVPVPGGSVRIVIGVGMAGRGLRK